MSRSTFSGPLRSENGFQLVSKSETTGQHTVVSNQNIQDNRRYTLSTYFDQLPALNAVIGLPGSGTTSPTAAEFAAYTIANKQFEVLGTNMTTALSTASTLGGITLTTAGASADQAIVAPHLDTNQTTWQTTQWATQASVIWEGTVSTPATITSYKFWAGLKLTNTGVVATDDDQAYFKFQTAATNGEVFSDFTLLYFIYSIAGTDYISQLPITVAASTVYNLKIIIDSNRQATIFVNGTQYNLASTAGSTGGTAVTSLQASTPIVLSLALTTSVNLIPYIGVQASTSAARALNVHYQSISRVIV